MTEVEKQELFDYLMEQEGTTAKEAVELTEYKAENYEDIERVISTIHLARTIPLSMLPTWDELGEDTKKAVLWELGLNTKEYAYCIDVRCTRIGTKVVCQKVIVGCERLDEAWLDMTVNGERVASEEARYGLLMVGNGVTLWDITEERIRLNGISEAKID